jgi:hypothetical protein
VNLIGQKKSLNICMKKLFLRMTEVFLDTSFAIALSSVTDQNHVRAVQLTNQIEINKSILVTIEWVLQLPKGSPSLEEEAFSRDSIYE